VLFDVADAFRPDVAGRYELVVRGGQATCQRVRERSAEGESIALDVSDLGSACLGGVPFSTLARAGRVRATAATLALADAVFASTPRPWCATGF
jgi:predicted acetyltransferase